MLWLIELKFCISLCLTVLQIKFECRQFASIFVGVMPLLEYRILKIHSFPHFSLTCFDTLTWNFAFHSVLLYFEFECCQLPSNFVGVMPLLDLEYWKIHRLTVFNTFLLHALTYQAEILHMTLIYCTTDQVRALSISVIFWWSYTPFGM